jgi:hypothetical protein
VGQVRLFQKLSLLQKEVESSVKAKTLYFIQNILDFSQYKQHQTFGFQASENSFESLQTQEVLRKNIQFTNCRNLWKLRDIFQLVSFYFIKEKFTCWPKS